MRFRRTRPFLCALASLITLAGCATEQQAVTTGPTDVGGRFADEMDDGGLLTMARHGLEVRRWRIVPRERLKRIEVAGGMEVVVEDESGERMRTPRARVGERWREALQLEDHRQSLALQQSVLRAMEAAEPVVPVDDETAAALRRNGLRIVRIPLERAEALLAALGPAPSTRTTWHGQAHEWRPLIERAVEDDGEAIVVNGRVRPFMGGSLELAARGWTVQLEDGPSVYVELAAEYGRRRAEGFAELLGRREREAARFPSMSLGLFLETGYAYIVSGERPGIEWIEGEGNEDDRGGGAAESGADRAGANGGGAGDSVGRSAGDAGGVGPVTAAPVTIGERLFIRERGEISREFLVLIARIPERFQIRAMPASGID